MSGLNIDRRTRFQVVDSLITQNKSSHFSLKKKKSSHHRRNYCRQGKQTENLWEKWARNSKTNKEPKGKGNTSYKKLYGHEVRRGEGEAQRWFNLSGAELTGGLRAPCQAFSTLNGCNSSRLPRGTFEVTICLRNHLWGNKIVFGRYPKLSPAPYHDNESVALPSSADEALCYNQAHFSAAPN